MPTEKKMTEKRSIQGKTSWRGSCHDSVVEGIGEAESRVKSRYKEGPDEKVMRSSNGRYPWHV